MRIGIDIDGVIASMDNALLKEYLKHDKELRNTGIINKNPKYIRWGMFDWSEEEEKTFYNANIERIATNLKPINNSKQIIDKLKADGNKIYIITGRDNGDYSNPKKMTEDWLRKYEIYYDKLIFTNAYKNEKSAECIKNNIDIMIEDSVSNCREITKNSNTKVLLMDRRFNKETNEFERVNNWKEIYSKISALYPKKETEKINVILDTDTYNECDDQFALAYMLKSQDRFNIEAITIAPYQHDNSLSIQEGQEKSYQEVLKICKWIGFNAENKVFKGSEDYITDRYNEITPAVDKIIETALKNDKTYIMAIGAITNIAIAIIKEPKIIDKIEVIWLGGHSLLNKDNLEFNFRQDIQAVKSVFESKVKLTIIPCKNVASNLKTSIYEIEHYLKAKSELCNYLCERFYNDGKHGIQTRRPIWDISVVAYLINKEWFETVEINCPNIKQDTSYDLNTNNHEITIVNYLDTDKIYEDLFKKLTNKYNYEYDVYLAGTCNNSKWREELIQKFNAEVSYINPQTTNWNHDVEMKMRKEKQKCKYILYVITSEMKGVLAIANLVDLANKCPERLLFCYIKEGFDDKQIASLEEVKFLLKEHNVKIFDNLDEVAEFINKI